MHPTFLGGISHLPSPPLPPPTQHKTSFAAKDFWSNL